MYNVNFTYIFYICKQNGHYNENIPKFISISFLEGKNIFSENGSFIILINCLTITHIIHNMPLVLIFFSQFWTL